MKRKDEFDGVKCERALYEWLRTHRSQGNRGWSYWLWRRWHRPERTTFIVDSKGEALHLPSRRAALIAEYRIFLLQQDLPVGFVASFDRTDN